MQIVQSFTMLPQGMGLLPSLQRRASRQDSRGSESADEGLRCTKVLSTFLRNVQTWHNHPGQAKTLPTHLAPGKYPWSRRDRSRTGEVEIGCFTVYGRIFETQMDAALSFLGDILVVVLSGWEL